uniref:Uncharacterized protein n=1 Tax=Anguilla anguilla TaxID=7936 RepID=A0A0E9WV38_ANGAN
MEPIWQKENFSALLLKSNQKAHRVAYSLQPHKVPSASLACLSYRAKVRI